MSKRLMALFVVYFMFFVSGLVRAEAEKTDDTLKLEKKLNIIGAIPTGYNNGVYAISVKWSADKRKHTVYVSTGKNKLDNEKKIVEICAPAAVVPKDNFKKFILTALLNDNGTRIIGAFEIGLDNFSKKRMLVFCARILDDVDPSSLSSIINYVGATADNVEAKFNNKDEF